MLHWKQHAKIVHPFYEPVGEYQIRSFVSRWMTSDPVRSDVQTYSMAMKKPMDLSWATVQTELENHEYLNASKFLDDFKLMVRNCITFNPAGMLHACQLSRCRTCDAFSMRSERICHRYGRQARRKGRQRNTIVSPPACKTTCSC